MTLGYTPVAFVNQGAGGAFFRHETQTLHQLEPGITYRRSIWNLDFVGTLRYPLIVASRDWLNVPTAALGSDYWAYLLSIGFRFGIAQFPSLEAGQRVSFFVSLVVGVGL